MPRPGLRTRRRRKKTIRLPGKRLVTHYEKPRSGRAVCAGCGTRLHGVNSSRGLAASEHAPSRAYAGIYCPSCLKKFYKQAARGPA